MTLEAGKKAPAFNVPNQDGQKVSLKSLAGKYVILYFYPKDLTPGCTTESSDFNELKASFGRNGAVILGVSKDSVERHVKFVEKLGLKFDLLSDESGTVCEKYGVWQEKKLYGKSFMGIVRTTIIISPEGKILKIYPKVRVKEHAANVLADLKQLKKEAK